MRLSSFACLLAVLVRAVHGTVHQSGAKVCSGGIQGLCTQDFDVVDSTFGVILPPLNPKRSTLYEEDVIIKSVQALPYGTAGMASSAPNGTLHFVVAGYGVGKNRLAVKPNTSGISTVTNTVIARVLVNGTSLQSTTPFALQSPSPGQDIPCNVLASPSYLFTNQQLTYYVRLQGCEVIRTTSPTTINFFRTDTPGISADAHQESAIFPIDGQLKMGSVLIDDIDQIRTSRESYNAALAALQLD